MGYWDYKGKLELHALEHTNRVKQQYYDEIRHSIDTATIYSATTPQARPDNAPRPQFILEKMDTVSALFKYQSPCICVLNFASNNEPGGMFLEGSNAQEECLCHASTLYPVLKAFDIEYYDWNRKNKNNGQYRNRALFTPKIIFEQQEEKVVADVITCAMPNYRYHRVPYVINQANVSERVNLLYEVANDQKVRTLIAGAWGCGVFVQDPEFVCRCLMENAWGVEKVIFAVPGGENYYAFKEVMNK